VGVLLLLRHGQGSMGTSDYDQLSELGYRQARSAGARLARADLSIGQVWSGALARQQDTALAVLAELGRPPSDLRTDVGSTSTIPAMSWARTPGAIRSPRPPRRRPAAPCR